MSRPQHATRGRLLDAALDAFSEKGFAGASIRDITRRVGIRESAFYAHFASKREAYAELLSQAGPAVATRAMERLETIDSPAEFFGALMRASIDSWSAPIARKLLTIFLRDAFAGEGDEWRGILSGVDTALATLAPRLTTWQTEGKITGAVPAAQLALLFMAPIATTRIMFFNSAAGDEEALRGRHILEAHVTAFIALTATPPSV